VLLYLGGHGSELSLEGGQGLHLGELQFVREKEVETSLGWSYLGRNDSKDDIYNQPVPPLLRTYPLD